MTPDRSALETQLVDALLALEPTPGASASPVAADLERLFDVQVASRHCDLAARWLRSQQKGYYTIGSSGHESNAAVAMALRDSDPALLHYRSGGFFLARKRGVRRIIADVLRENVAMRSLINRYRAVVQPSGDPLVVRYRVDV